MTDAEIDAMPPGRQLDNLIHRLVAKLGDTYGVPYYSCNVIFSLDVLDAFVRRRGIDWFYKIHAERGRSDYYCVVGSNGARVRRYLSESGCVRGLPGMALAICRCLLKAGEGK